MVHAVDQNPPGLLLEYLGILFTSDWKMEREDDRWIGAASIVMWTLYQSAVMERELTQQLSIYRSVYVLPLTYGNKLWVVIEKKMRLWI